MNCNSAHQMNNCLCHSSFGIQFWSKKKKIKMLEHYLECLEEKKEDITEMINELKN